MILYMLPNLPWTTSRDLEWPSQSPDLSIIENLWVDLKRAVHARWPKNIAELKAFCSEEWEKILNTTIEMLLSWLQKHLQAVIVLYILG